jgi:hypothetical protein
MAGRIPHRPPASIVSAVTWSRFVTGLTVVVCCRPAPRQIAIFMGKTDPSAPTHQQQSMIIVPMDAPGVKVIRPMMVYGYDDAPHGHAEVRGDWTAGMYVHVGEWERQGGACPPSPACFAMLHIF